jgi:hypothetical protein
LIVVSLPHVHSHFPFFFAFVVACALSKAVNGAAHWTFGGETVLFTVSDDRECRSFNLRDNQVVKMKGERKYYFSIRIF